MRCFSVLHSLVNSIVQRSGNGTASCTISSGICYFPLLLLAFMHMPPSGSSQLPGGHHEGAAVKMPVPTLGSPRRTVASAAAPGAVPAWTRFSEHGPSKMFIFTRFYKVFCDAREHHKFVDFPMVFHGFRDCLSLIISLIVGNSKSLMICSAYATLSGTS